MAGGGGGVIVIKQDQADFAYVITVHINHASSTNALDPPCLDASEGSQNQEQQL